MNEQNGGMAGFRGARECDSNIASKLIFGGIIDRFPGLAVGDGVYLTIIQPAIYVAVCVSIACVR